MKLYKLADVKKVCDVIYGKEIDRNTWSRWKRKLLIPKSSREVDLQRLEQIITLTNIKRARPYFNPDLYEIVKMKTEALKEFHDTKYTYQLYLLPDRCRGSEIGNILKMLTGRLISNKSLYRWGEETGIKFSTNNTYTKDEILKIIHRELPSTNFRHSSDLDPEKAS